MCKQTDRIYFSLYLRSGAIGVEMAEGAKDMGWVLSYSLFVSRWDAVKACVPPSSSMRLSFS